MINLFIGLAETDLLCGIRDNTRKYKREKQDNRFTWFTNKLATSTGRGGAVLLWRGKKQNYRIGFAIASIYSAKLRPNRLGPKIHN